MRTFLYQTLDTANNRTEDLRKTIRQRLYYEAIII